MPRKRAEPPRVKHSEGLSQSDALPMSEPNVFIDDFTGQAMPVKVQSKAKRPTRMVEPKPEAQNILILMDAGLIAKLESELVVPKGKRIVATLQTKDGPRYILEPIKSLRRL